MKNSKSVRLQNLVKRYNGAAGRGVLAVNDVTLDVAAGEFVTLLGPSGCGKTTILRMIAGFETPTSGNIYIGGEEVTRLTPDKRDTAMVFQSYALFPHLTIFENIAYGLRIKKMKDSDIRAKVSHILELVGLTGLEGRYPNQLSGGQQQRVALARSLVMEPSVLLFDEPLSNLDAKLRVHMRGEIRRIQRDIGITSIYVTHDQSEAMSMSDRIVIMNQGNIEQIGSPFEIYTRPRTKFVADFIGMANILAGEVVAVGDGTATVRFLGQAFAVATDLVLSPGEPVSVVLRPETLRLAAEGPLAVQVTASVFMGAYQDYKITAGGQSLTVIDYDPVQKAVFQAGDRAALLIRPESVHILKS
ncbi:ABC transporter ATP-binding protein [Sporolituus thermophilus]|uniref:Iron(III) transport system ATP-binding protein n=1 Tax=Sporolituus thermophilus DSM 23256 TaxID=1123285 RepID=A0A1G7MYS5_9FIRM|nr:ABC transporter ATP-binding protein [Sporolituus thermophilus]SDF66269.1 iron(III) transport system ATP-binding protein [Sporolituus thermophilus DSM 23256]